MGTDERSASKIAECVAQGRKTRIMEAWVMAPVIRILEAHASLFCEIWGMASQSSPS